MRTLALAVAGVLTVIGPTVAQKQEHDQLFEKIDDLVKPLLKEKITVGVVVGVLKDGVPTARGYGKVTKDSDAIPDGDTVYEIGSISKVFTGILLADAVGRKLVKLEDPAQKFLPAEATVPRHKEGPIRLVHLTTHTSALPRLPGNFKPGDPRDPYVDFTAELLYQGLGKITLDRPPGEQYLYSNLAVGLLGHVLTLANKAQSYEALLQERISRPLGLADTRITLNASMRKRLATPYDAGGRRQHNWGFDVLVGAGGIRSTAHDMLRFAGQNLATGVDDDLHKAMALARQPHFRGQPRVGLGWHMGALPDTIWHNGGTGGYRTYLALHMKRRFAVVVLANTTSKMIDQLANRVFVLVMGRKVAPLQVRKAVTVDRKVLARYVGEYRLSAGAKFSITLGEEGLSARLTGQPAFRIYPLSKTRFFYRVVKAEIEFQVKVTGQGQGEGEVTALVLFQHGQELEAKKIK